MPDIVSLYWNGIMDIKRSFGDALRQARKARNMSQEDFSIISSRTYISSLERGLKSPTLEKVDIIAEEMGLHPLTLLTLAYSRTPKSESVSQLIAQINAELDEVT
jgi:transcriptional regulator with XRE-family HTH domain